MFEKLSHEFTVGYITVLMQLASAQVSPNLSHNYFPELQQLNEITHINEFLGSLCMVTDDTATGTA